MIIFIATVNNNCIVHIVFSCQEMFWISVPLSIEKHLVINHISQKYHSSVLIFTPPWSESVKALIILTCKIFFNILSISDLFCHTKIFIKRCHELVLKADFILSSSKSNDIKEYGSVERINAESAFFLNIYLINCIGSS